MENCIKEFIICKEECDAVSDTDMYDECLRFCDKMLHKCLNK